MWLSEDGGTHGLTADSVAQALRHEPRSLLALLLVLFHSVA